eukprot:3166191-Rhodomonas_salina.1
MLNTTAWASSPLLRDRARIRPAVMAAFLCAMALVGFVVVSVPLVSNEVELGRAGLVQQRSQLLARQQVTPCSLRPLLCFFFACADRILIAKATKQILASNPDLAHAFYTAHHDKHVRHVLKGQLTMLCDEVTSAICPPQHPCPVLTWASGPRGGRTRNTGRSRLNLTRSMGERMIAMCCQVSSFAPAKPRPSLTSGTVLCQRALGRRGRLMTSSTTTTSQRATGICVRARHAMAGADVRLVAAAWMTMRSRYCTPLILLCEGQA